jgi:hypothetical protein
MFLYPLRVHASSSFASIYNAELHYAEGVIVIIHQPELIIVNVFHLGYEGGLNLNVQHQNM